MIIKKNKLAFGCFLIVFLLNNSSCGTVSKETGMCKEITEVKYTASTFDDNGNGGTLPWKITVGDDADETIGCSTPGTNGVIIMSVTIIDGYKVPKPGLALLPVVWGVGTTLDDADAMKVTNSCGESSFILNWKCPEEGKTFDGFFQAKSGALVSKVIKVSISPAATKTMTK